MLISSAAATSFSCGGWAHSATYFRKASARAAVCSVVLGLNVAAAGEARGRTPIRGW